MRPSGQSSYNLKKNLFAIGIYFGIALLMRFLSFFPTVIDHDESTYILIADALWEGKRYLVDVVDTKPVGIFLLFGFFQQLFGESVIAIRIIATVWIALTAWGIHQVHRTLGGQGGAPFASGLMYVVMTSIYTFYGISPNTELFFALFTIIALWLLLQPPHLGRFLVAGLCLGFGFTIKYVVLFDALAFALFLFWKARREYWAWSHTLALGTAGAVGFAIPFTMIGAYYWSQGYGHPFLFYTFEVSSNYFIERPWTDFIVFVMQGFGRYFLVSFFFFYALFDRSVEMRAFKTLIILWSLSILYIILAPGKLFDHYFIQFMLPFSLMAGSFFDARRALPAWMANAFAPRIGYTILLLLIVANFFFQKKDYVDKPDYVEQVADYLDDYVKPEDIIYTGNYQQIIYHLLDKDSPTPFVHRSLLWDPENVEALALNQAAELQRILRQSPRFIIYQGELPLEMDFSQKVWQNYKVVKTFPKQIHIYERIERFSEKPQLNDTSDRKMR